MKVLRSPQTPISDPCQKPSGSRPQTLSGEVSFLPHDLVACDPIVRPTCTRAMTWPMIPLYLRASQRRWRRRSRISGRAAPDGCCGCTKKAASTMSCPAITPRPRRCTPTSRQLVSPMTRRVGCSAPPKGIAEPISPRSTRCRHHRADRQPQLRGDRYHRLSRQWRHAGTRAGDGGA